MNLVDTHEQYIYNCEIWKKTQCLNKEEQINQTIFDCLASQGFGATDHFRIWSRGSQKVIVCLVDDLLSCSTDYHSDLPYIFDANTTVITDNCVTCPTQYKIISLPKSFFGIYSYQPDCNAWSPDRLFSFTVNRIDYRRFKLMLDLAWRQGLDQGYVNFNCLKRLGYSGGYEQSSAPFVEIWEQLPEADQQRFVRVYQMLQPLMPLKNYELEFDQVLLHSYLNMVVESYSSDNNISVSEKIFRSLVTPAPWTVYSGRYTVAWLESLGFDCMRDMIDHNHYDRLKEVEDKIRTFNWKSLEIAKHLQSMPIEQVRERCQQASTHNQNILSSMQQQWHTDFKSWIETLPSQLAQRPTWG
jgi:hypothetical protein